ncbi:MAG TPA: 4'-phosphopantetheinyl transferase superfamily protein [Candidatus Binatia bacterium]|nr:4'-phosphopantetheinyl transferase superfamily protein [Candidatus Binatia bacterium]
MLPSPTSKIAAPTTLWLLNSLLVSEDDLAMFAKRIGASEAQRYAGFKRQGRRRQFLAGRMLLRFAISHLTATLPRIVERPGNAPQVVFPNSEPQPRFSLAHSGGWVACVVSPDTNLGLDIEINDASRDIAGISELAFHRDEILWLSEQPEWARLPAFYRLWCTKEALYKLSCSLGLAANLPPLLGADGVTESRGRDWHCYSLPHPDLTVVLAADHPLSKVRKIELAGLTLAEWLSAGHPPSLGST